MFDEKSVDPSACLDQELERADDEDLGPGYLPHRGVFAQPPVEGVRVTKHLWVQQQRSGDLLVHLVLSSPEPSAGASDSLPESDAGGIVVRHTRNNRAGRASRDE